MNPDPTKTHDTANYAARAARQLPPPLRHLHLRREPALVWSLAGTAALVAIWGLLATVYPSILVPSPPEVAAALARLALSGRLWPALSLTVARLALAFALGSALGAGLGLLAGRSAPLAGALRPALSVATGVPPIAWIALALIWFGTGSLIPIVVALLVTLPVVYSATLEGVHALDRDLVAMARLYGLRGLALLRELYLPALAPHLLSGLSVGAGLTVRVGVMGEFLGASAGVGSEMALARSQLNTAEVLAWVLVALALLGASEGLLLRPLARRAAAWRGVG